MSAIVETTFRGAAAPREVEVAGHRLVVFVESPALFEAMLADIKGAKERVWVEVYIFFNDAGGTRIAEALKERARAGVDVRVLYDAVGSAGTPGRFFAEMIDAGVKVHAYHTFWEGVRKMRPLRVLNRRNHRKLMIVDDLAGYFGGMNLIDNVENVEQRKAEKRPMSSGWRDVHVRLEGPQQGELAESFVRSWARANGEKIGKRSREYCRAQMAGGEESIRFFDSGTGAGTKRYSRAARVFTSLLKRASVSVTISMAYFIPVGSVFRELLKARRRRVRMRVIVPGKSDVKIVQRATAFLYRFLLRRGFRIYERQGRMLHSKVMVVDEQWTSVGSCNMDPRSLFINLEFLAVIRSKKLAEVMTEICRNEMSASRIVKQGDCGESWWQRFLNRMAWELRWWL